MLKKMSVVVMMVAVLVFGATSFAGASSPNPTIVGIASSNPNFSTLVQAVSKAGLVDALNGKGQTTVFAPTNPAFDAAAKVALSNPDATGMDLVNALDAATLKAVILYHAAPGSRYAADVVASERIRTLSKQFLFPYLAGDPIKAYLKNNVLPDAQIIATDIPASNGVIHVIDQVLLPPMP